MSRTQAPTDIVLRTVDINNADTACRSTSPSIEEVRQVTSTDRDAIEGDRPNEVINQTRGLDEQATVEQHVAAQFDDNMSPPSVQDSASHANYFSEILLEKLTKRHKRICTHMCYVSIFKSADKQTNLSFISTAGTS